MKSVDLIVNMLERAGVRWIFGVPSGPVLPLIEALRQSAIQYVLTASETSAGFMATAVGHLTGTPGVAVSTLGPGATNLATGVGCAWLDRAPVLALTCNVPTPWLERRVQMRIDHHALFQPITKASYPLRAGRVAAPLAAAVALALAEPPGPVHLDLPEDVATAPASDEAELIFPRNALADIGSAASAAVARALAQSRRPLVVTGLTFTRSRGAKDLLQFVEKQALPFVSTLHAKGFLPESHPNWAGVLERARRSDVRAFVRRADLVIAFGYDPIEVNYEDWIGGAALIHISTEKADVGPEVRVLFNEGGDMDGAIRALGGVPKIANDWTTDDFAAHRALLAKSLRPPCDGLGPHHVTDLVREKLPRDGILVYDVGAHTHQIAAQWQTDRPWSCLSTNGWSSMGYGMPAAYAAKLVHPDREVIAVVGDGCFQMTVGELAVAKRMRLAVPTIVLNDGWLGLIKVKQERKSYGLAGVFLGEPSASPTHYFGVPCRPAKTASELRRALDWAFNVSGPSVIEAFIDVEPYSKTVYD
ncbi:MAG TPA: thiamine pyrophosphate-binding protein [Candidatus Acidoferrales bacterium]|nr:thiamine pyrophosphate-binding protein [Candidatus Acidoferrales bacterium]